MLRLLLGTAVALCVPPVRAAEPAPAGRLERLRGLSEKWESGGLSAEEKDEFLHILGRQLLGLKEAPAPASETAAPAASGNGDKVIAVYRDRNTTKLVIEARRPLVAGAPVFAGRREMEATLLDLLSRSGDLYYYAAAIPGKAPVDEGDAVVTRRTRVLETPSPLRLKIEEAYTFEPKEVGEVTAVQEGRAMIDRGTLHEVRERDIYRILDSSGHHKGFIEIRGIGDLQSSGELYNRFEDRRKRALETAPGDRVKFLGQRKLFGLGGLYGVSFGGRREFGATESGYGAGLLWNLMFQNGWGVEVVFGSFENTLKGKESITIIKPPPPFTYLTRTAQEVEWKATYLFPVAVKKNFFFPSVVSPFVLAGASYFNAKLVKNEEFVDPFATVQNLSLSHIRAVKGISPMVGGGVELFPARLIRPRFDLRWFSGPTVRTADKAMRVNKLFMTFSVVSAW